MEGLDFWRECVRPVGKRGRVGSRYLSHIDHDSLARRRDHPRPLRLWGKNKLWKKAMGRSRKRRKKYLSCKTLEVIITFAGRTGNLGNLGRGLGSLEWELGGRNNYMYSIEQGGAAPLVIAVWKMRSSRGEIRWKKGRGGSERKIHPVEGGGGKGSPSIWRDSLGSEYGSTVFSDSCPPTELKGYYFIGTHDHVGNYCHRSKGPWSS